MSTPSRLLLGLPLWSHPGWVSTLYRGDAKPRDFLRQYAQVFSCVEGNTTFYASPSPETVARWVQQTPASFRFLFKLPRRITHDLLLSGPAIEEAYRFLSLIEPLRERVSHLLLQLPPRFSPAELPALAHFLERLPAGPIPKLRAAVEPRHPAFFEPSGPGESLHAILKNFGAERALMDTRPLRSARPPYDRHTAEALDRKPALPVWPFALGEHPVVRFVGHPSLAANRPWLEQWASQLTQWLAEGRSPYFFAHFPAEQLAPELAELLTNILEKRGGCVSLPSWPGRAQANLFENI